MYIKFNLCNKSILSSSTAFHVQGEEICDANKIKEEAITTITTTETKS